MVAPDVHEDMQRFADSGVVAVMRGVDADTIIDVADTPYEDGATVYETTADNPDAMDLIREVSVSFSDNKATAGAGIVLGAPTTNAVIQTGAELAVGPNSDEGVVETCNRCGTLVAPGTMTPTEVTDAYSVDADLVEVFPASSLGPGYFKSMKEPSPQTPMMPTGGVGPDSATDYIEADVVVIGAGGVLVDDKAIENSDFEAITETAREFSNIIDDARDD